MGGLWFGWSWGQISSPFLPLLSVLCFLNLTIVFPSCFLKLRNTVCQQTPCCFSSCNIKYPYQWKWASHCDRGPLVRKICFYKSRRLYLVLHSWTDLNGTAQFSEGELGQHWAKQSLIHWNAWGCLSVMHFNTLERGLFHINCHWFCWTKGKLLEAFRETILVAPRYQNHAMQPMAS